MEVMAQKRRSNRGKGGAKSKKVPSEAPLPLAARLRLTDASVVETAAAADTESATVTTPAAVFEGVGTLEANATIVSGVGTARVSRNALSERPVEIRDAAYALSQEFTAYVEELKRTKPNDSDGLAKYDDLVAFLEKMAAGLSNLADALDQAVNKAAEGKLEPMFLGTAAEVARQLQLGAMEWLKKNRTTIFDVPIRIGLIGIGLTFVHEIAGPYVAGLTAYLARKTSKGADAPKKKR
jgi:hypothetical protein